MARERGEREGVRMKREDREREKRKGVDTGKER